MVRMTEAWPLGAEDPPIPAIKVWHFHQNNTVLAQNPTNPFKRFPRPSFMFQKRPKRYAGEVPFRKLFKAADGISVYESSASRFEDGACLFSGSRINFDSIGDIGTW